MSAETLRCVKCGGTNIHTRYDATGYECLYGDHARDTEATEHLHRYCRTCSWDWSDPIAASPAPPVATTGAVPRKAITNVLNAADFHADVLAHAATIGEGSEQSNARGLAKMYREDIQAVRDWLSAAPAPKASEGEAKPITKAWPDRFDCANCGQGVKADEDGCCSMCGQDCVQVIGGEYVTDAQPHARAEGASADIREAFDTLTDLANDLWPEQTNEHRKASDAIATLRRALSGSAEGTR